MDLTLPSEVERAARTIREFVESHLLTPAPPSRLPLPLAGLAPLVEKSPLAHFAVFRELGRVPAPWAETFRAAGLQFHDLPRAGVKAPEAGLVGLALGDPRRRPDPDALGVQADRATTWQLHGVAVVPEYLAPVDSLLIAATLSGDAPDVGVFLATGSFGEGGVTLDRTPARLLERGEAAWQLLLALRRRARLSQIALAVGAASRAHELSLAAARQATAAKDPLALGQGIQFQVADDAIDLQMAETLALHSATLAESGALTEADLASTRFMVLEALERIALRAGHIANLFASTTPPWTRFFLELARRLRLEGGAVELDRREAALGLLQSA